RDVAPAEDEEQRRDQDAAASEQEEPALPAPVTAIAQQEQGTKANIDQGPEDQDPPLRRDAKEGEGRDQGVGAVRPGVLAGCCGDGREGDGYREGQREPGVEADPEEDEPEPLAPGQPPA